MHDGDYRNIFGPELVDHREGKPVYETPSNRGTCDKTPSVRTSSDLCQRAFDLPDKVRTQAGCTSFVEFGRGDKFAFGQRVEG
jgi:hypothetical protein